MILASDLHLARTNPADIEALLAACLSPEHDPERAVILAGDLVQHNSREEYALAGRLLGELLDGGVTVVLTPGNHDFGQILGEKFGSSGRKRFAGLLESVLAQKAVLARQDFDSVTAIGHDLFVALASTQRGQGRKLYVAGENRIRRKQIEWAAAELERVGREGRRLHLVTHRSLWSDAEDEHGRMVRKERLERELLEPLGFTSFIHGHNHRFEHGDTTTPRIGYRINRIALPTLSSRDRGWERGWVRWTPPDGEAELVVPG